MSTPPVPPASSTLQTHAVTVEQKQNTDETKFGQMQLNNRVVIVDYSGTNEPYIETTTYVIKPWFTS
jgi:hypothetical protein